MLPLSSAIAGNSRSRIAEAGPTTTGARCRGVGGQRRSGWWRRSTGRRGRRSTRAGGSVHAALTGAGEGEVVPCVVQRRTRVKRPDAGRERVLVSLVPEDT